MDTYIKDEYIRKQIALEAIRQIRYKIWLVDIPSPTVPEYIEHHEQMTELIKYCDDLIKKIEQFPLDDISQVIQNLVRVVNEK